MAVSGRLTAILDGKVSGRCGRLSGDFARCGRGESSRASAVSAVVDGGWGRQVRGAGWAVGPVAVRCAEPRRMLGWGKEGPLREKGRWAEGWFRPNSIFSSFPFPVPYSFSGFGFLFLIISKFIHKNANKFK